MSFGSRKKQKTGCEIISLLFKRSFINSSYLFIIKNVSESSAEDSSDVEYDAAHEIRNIFSFEKGHPRQKTVGHRYRKIECWPKYSAKRLPDVEQLSHSSDLSFEERDAKREEYAQGVLIMFHPFRTQKGKTKCNSLQNFQMMY